MLLEEESENKSKISPSQSSQQRFKDLRGRPQQEFSTSLLQRDIFRSDLLLHRDILQLQQAIGNQAVTRLLAKKQGLNSRLGSGKVQRGVLGEFIDSATGADRAFDVAVLSNISAEFYQYSSALD